MGRHRSQPPAVAPLADRHWELRLPAMSLVLEQAPSVIAGAHDHAAGLGIHISASVVDEDCHL